MITMQEMSEPFDEEENQKTGEHPLLNVRPTLKLDPEEMARIVEWSEADARARQETTSPLLAQPEGKE